MNDIRDIKPPLALDDGPGWLVLAAAVLVAAITGLLVWRLRRTAPQRRAAKTLARALRKLESEAADLNDRTFAYRLAELLRQALFRRTGIAAPTLTTGEILSLLPATALPPPLRQAVADALLRADPPRYAAPSRGPGGHHAPQPPEASVFPASPRQTDLETVRALLQRKGRPWSA